jgi:hypothetical protein
MDDSARANRRSGSKKESSSLFPLRRTFYNLGMLRRIYSVPDLHGTFVVGCLTAMRWRVSDLIAKYVSGTGYFLNKNVWPILVACGVFCFSHTLTTVGSP